VRYERLARGIGEALGPVAHRVEHVGSTSVPGLSAKPVIDIQLSVGSFEPREPYGAPLVALGYWHRTDDDEPDQHRFFGLDDGSTRLANLHVCLARSDWERRHVAFRDHLRAHPEAMAEYDGLKRRLAREFPFDVHAYAQGKTPLIRRIERDALGLPRLSPGQDDPIEVVPWDPSWASLYEAEAARIREAVGDRVTCLEHVGSTAVPGLAARPIVDILLTVRSFEPRGDYVPALEALGYEAKPDEGPGWQFLLRRRPRRFRLHVFDQRSEEIRRHLAFRDYLRARPDQADRYGRLKAILAEGFRHDRAGYLDAKAPYIWVIEQRVREEGFE